jgi:23S rRNA pseudouridine2605 synthase
MKERLQKIIARAGICSRRAAETLIREGKVTVDGRIVTEMGLKVDHRHQKIIADRVHVRFTEKKVYVLLNKPEGYVTTMNDPQGRPIVTSLVKEVAERIYPVGRLDFETKGALILTNDGDLAQRIQHPSFEVKKTYVARVQGKPTSEEIKMLESGVELEGRMTAPAGVKVYRRGKKDSVLEITIHEGRKHQVRKMCQAIGHHCVELTRIAYGNLTLGSLAPGKFRYLYPKDLARITGTSGKNKAVKRSKKIWAK